MQKLKLMTVVGTRPEIIKMSSIIKKCDIYFDHVIVHTGQNYDYTLNQVFFKDLGLREPDHYLGVVGENLGQTMGNVISKAYELMIEIKPDAVIMLGDTNSCLSVIAAKRLKIPIFHMEAGNRCKDENLPEEVIRRIVDTTSDINLCYSENARYYLLSSGSKPEYTFVVGSPMLEVLSANPNAVQQSKVLEFLNLKPKEYILLSAHREENIDNDSNFFSLMNAINHLANYMNKTILYSCHPRSKKKIIESGFEFHQNIQLHEPFGFWDYIKLQQNSLCVISDSGTLPEESAILQFPAVSLRTSTERPEAIDSGVFVIGSIFSREIIQAVEMVTSMSITDDRSSVVQAYCDVNVSSKVVKIIQSYTPIVNKMIWRKGI
jgi:UDP-N-acetylglucosamine 2-epimerase (non-hydrolysing)